jgi:hypothetical protein
MPDPKTITYIFAAILLSCLVFSLGGFLGKKFEVFRVVIFAAAVLVTCCFALRLPGNKRKIIVL